MTTPTTTLDITDLIDRIQQLLRERYILEPDASLIAAGLDEATADLTPTDDPAQIADLLTTRMQQINGDRHLRLLHRPAGAATGLHGAEYEARWAADAIRNAGGIRQVRLLNDGVGLLQIAPYLSPVHLAQPYITAAFTLLASVRGLIIDLRDGWQGGTPETVALICGHLLADEPVHLQDIHERGVTPRQYWTTPAAIRIDAPIQVLTSHATFSGCEELAYDLQARQRAVLVGEATGGGAHPIEAFQVADTLELHLPVAASVNTTTGTNWERTGVTPDHPCPADRAMEIALQNLLSAGTPT